MSNTVWTVGHSTRPLEEFLSLTASHGIRTLADVRRFPMSRRHPQFNETDLRAALEAAGVSYLWLPSLGGRRKPAPDSPNTGWRNEAFRGYADHMQSDEFADGFAKLLDAATTAPTAIMCAEAVWWRCHRALISDALKVREWAVLHIADEKRAAEHKLTPPARIVDGRLTYADNVLFATRPISECDCADPTSPLG